MGNFFIGAIQLILALSVFPVVCASAVSFVNHLGGYSGTFQDFLKDGILAYLIIFLFVFKFSRVYEFGQNLIAQILSFIAPVNKPISYLIPFYLPVVMCLLFGVNQVFSFHDWDHYFYFFAGFIFAMHILESAHALQEQDKVFIKPSYLLLMSFVIVANLALAVLLFDMTEQKFSFPEYYHSVLEHSEDNYSFAFDKFVMWK